MTDPTKRQKILIVDDTLAHVDVLKDILKSDYKLSIALDGEQALEMARITDPPDLILLDVMMPGMDGYEVCRCLQADKTTRNIPIIFVTAKTEVEDEAEGLKLGAVDYVTKPYNAKIVEQRVKNHMELKRHRDRLEELVKERTARLEVAKEAAEAGNRAKGEFMMIMSHELRTPLNNIIGFTPMLAQPDLTPENRQEYVDIVSNSGNDLLELVNEIIDLVSVEVGAIQLIREPFPFPYWMQKIMDAVSPLAHEKGLTLTSQIDPDIPPFLIGDDRRLGQVLLHLLKNAVKFTDSGSIVLEVTREGHSPSEETLRFTIRDTGIGIPADKQETIFQHFTQLESPYTRTHEGIGLGLTICKRFVPLMGGRIHVESELGRGSVFHFAARFGTGSV